MDLPAQSIIYKNVVALLLLPQCADRNPPEEVHHLSLHPPTDKAITNTTPDQPARSHFRRGVPVPLARRDAADEPLPLPARRAQPTVLFENRPERRCVVDSLLQGLQ
jgi:hypothetical protein